MQKLDLPRLLLLPDKPATQHWEIQGDSYSESYTYDTGDGSLESMTIAGGQTLSYTYDFLKRHSATTVAKNGSTIFTVSKSYYNQTADTTLTTAQVQYYNVHNSAGTLIAGSQYVYDARGNITQIKESESPYRVLVEYDYDDLNQLVSETTYTYAGTSTVASSTIVNTFTYDTAGNLLKVYENGVEKDEYTYEDDDWQDLLTEFNGETITYDLSGNPLNWYNGNTYTDLSWVMGRQLESLTVQKDTEELDISYTYDMSGIRSSKTVVIREVEAHTHEYTSAVTAPTCTTAGYTTYTCDCGESYVDNLVDALGHSYVQSGNVYTCSRCGDSYTGHEHSYTESTTDPTCTEAGYTLYTCSCGDTYQVDLPALGHDYVLVNQSGTTGTYQCSRCGHTYSATIPVNPPSEEYSLRNSTAVTEHHEYIYASGTLLRETITTTEVVAATAITVATCGAGSVAGVAMITTTITVAARAAEVGILQAKKGKSEGKSDRQIAKDVVESIYNNGKKIIGTTPFSKPVGVGFNHYVRSGIMKAFGGTQTLSATLKESGGKLVAYGFAALACVNTAISLFSDDPVARAEQRGYTLI